MGISDENRILMKKIYVLKVAEENLLRNFRIKVGVVGTEQTFEKVASNWHDAYR